MRFAVRFRTSASVSGRYAKCVNIVRYVTWPIQNVNLRLLAAVGGIEAWDYLVLTKYVPRNCAGLDVGICLASEILTPQKG